jgi:hypothetical protein
MNVSSENEDDKMHMQATVRVEDAYRQLLAVFQRGQMTKQQFESHIENDPGFGAYVREVDGARINAWRC